MLGWSAKATLDAIGVATLVRDFNSVMHDSDELSMIYYELTDPSPARFVHFLISIMTGNNSLQSIPLPFFTPLAYQPKRLREICRGFISNKRAHIARDPDAAQHDILALLMNYNEFPNESVITD